MRSDLLLFFATALVSTACASAPPPGPARVATAGPPSAPTDAADETVAVTTTTLAAAVAEPPDDAKPEADADALPSACESESRIKNVKLCTVPKAFTKKLCAGVHPDVALAMFAKGTPWTRLWLAGDVDAWNASGGLTHRAKLAFDEEVVVLAKHGAGNAGGIVMTGAGASYDVLRFDGTCVSVMEGELTTRRPPAPKPAPVPWSRLGERTRHALLEASKVKSARDALEKACSRGDAKKACEKAEHGLAKAVLDHVRSGAALPAPALR